MASAELGRHGSLAHGMVIVASVRARVFGVRLLELDADVNVSPAPQRRRINRLEAAPGRRGRLTPQLSNGSIGGGLEQAARTIEASVTELEAARRRMP